MSVWNTDRLVLRFDNVQFSEIMSSILKEDKLIIEGKYLTYNIEEIFMSVAWVKKGG